MESRYLRMSQQAAPNVPQPSNFSYFAEQSRRAGYTGPEVRLIQHEHFRDPRNHLLPPPPPPPHHHVHVLPLPHPHFHPHPAPPIHNIAHEAIQREIEKQIIREEIIMSELARRRDLEAEVRRELMIERELARQRGSDGFSFCRSSPARLPLIGIRAEVRSLEERDGPSLERESEQNEALPFQRATAEPRISEVKPASEGGKKKEKVILLAKSDTDTSGSKRKVAKATEPASDIISSKKARAEWSCALCKVSSTSERALNEHLQGKKHRYKEAALRAEGASKNNIGIGLSSKKATKKTGTENGMKIVDECSTLEKASLENSNSNILKQNQTKIPELQNEGRKKNKFRFWCEMCQVGSFTQKIMNAHEEGKKHVRRLQESRQKNVVVVNHAEEVGEDGRVIISENVDARSEDHDPMDALKSEAEDQTSVEKTEGALDMMKPDPLDENVVVVNHAEEVGKGRKTVISEKVEGFSENHDHMNALKSEDQTSLKETEGGLDMMKPELLDESKAEDDEAVEPENDSNNDVVETKDAGIWI